MDGIDVSNHQSRDLSGYFAQFSPAHVVVKLYQQIEVSGGRAHAKAQIESARSHGKSVSGYVWLYRGIDPAQQVDDAIDLADEAALVLPILWVDFEDYQGVMPTVDELRGAVARADARGVRVGVYSSAYMWSKVGSPITELKERPLWIANYLSQPAIETVPLFGGWERELVWGHQWTSSPIDRNVFRAQATRR